MISVLTPSSWRDLAGKIYAAHGYPPELALVISRGELTARKINTKQVCDKTPNTGR